MTFDRVSPAEWIKRLRTGPQDPTENPTIVSTHYVLVLINADGSVSSEIGRVFCRQIREPTSGRCTRRKALPTQLYQDSCSIADPERVSASRRESGGQVRRVLEKYRVSEASSVRRCIGSPRLHILSVNRAAYFIFGIAGSSSSRRM